MNHRIFYLLLMIASVIVIVLAVGELLSASNRVRAPDGLTLQVTIFTSISASLLIGWLSVELACELKKLKK